MILEASVGILFTRSIATSRRDTGAVEGDILSFAAAARTLRNSDPRKKLRLLLQAQCIFRF
jgi:hypothetical protein